MNLLGAGGLFSSAFLGLTASLIGFLLLLIWGCMIALGVKVERPFNKLAGIVSTALCFSMLLGLYDRVPGDGSHAGGVLGAWIAERCSGAGTAGLSCLMLWLALPAGLLLATEWMFAGYIFGGRLMAPAGSGLAALFGGGKFLARAGAGRRRWSGLGQRRTSLASRAQRPAAAESRKEYAEEKGWEAVGAAVLPPVEEEEPILEEVESLNAGQPLWDGDIGYGEQTVTAENGEAAGETEAASSPAEPAAGTQGAEIAGQGAEIAGQGAEIAGGTETVLPAAAAIDSIPAGQDDSWWRSESVTAVSIPATEAMEREGAAKVDEAPEAKEAAASAETEENPGSVEHVATEEPGRSAGSVETHKTNWAGNIEAGRTYKEETVPDKSWWSTPRAEVDSAPQAKCSIAGETGGATADQQAEAAAENQTPPAATEPALKAEPELIDDPELTHDKEEAMDDTFPETVESSEEQALHGEARADAAADLDAEEPQAVFSFDGSPSDGSPSDGSHGPADSAHDENAELFRDAVALVVKEKKGSISLLQKGLGLGYFKAAKLLNQLESAGVIAPYAGSIARKLVISDEEAERVLSGGGPGA